MPKQNEPNDEPHNLSVPQEQRAAELNGGIHDVNVMIDDLYHQLPPGIERATQVQRLVGMIHDMKDALSNIDTYQPPPSDGQS